MSRAPVTTPLPRNVLLGIIALIMAALIGGWALYSNRRAATVTETPTPVVTPSTNTGAANSAGSSAASGRTSGATVPTAPATSAGTAGTTAGDVVTAPPFPVTDPNGSTPDPTAPLPQPSGINPNTPLLGLNGHNPFRPVKLDEPANNTAMAGSIMGSAPQPIPTPAVSITRPSSSAAQINSALTNTASTGAIPVAPVPGTTVSVPSSSRPSASSGSSGSSGGVIPITPLPGTPGPGAAPVSASNAPDKTVSIPSGGKAGSATGNATGNTTGNATGAADTKPAPIVPPVAGVSEPSVSIPGVTASTTGTNAGANAGTNAGATTGQTSPQVNLPAPTNPKAITETQTVPVPETPTVSALDQYVKSSNLIFDAAVLGPVNTAILRSEKGFIVATVGQPLPDSKVTVKEVTATSVTLALGSETTTLQLDKR